MGRRGDMKLGKAISTRIKALREAAGLSQQEVAMRGDLSLSLVAKLEQGKKADPRASTLLALARALQVRQQSGDRAVPVAASTREATTLRDLKRVPPGPPCVRLRTGDRVRIEVRADQT